jgi:hypothetical protein
MTMKGFVGQVPLGTQVGDKITIFEGSSVPFVVRQEAGNGAYKLVGACYIYGIMDLLFRQQSASLTFCGLTTLVPILFICRLA